ncbi:MAG: phage virion morphogenesis protein [Prevotellaceae bacterium]|nr:phage virion morphogenesis protein [Prevotellaceae bacterium]
MKSERWNIIKNVLNDIRVEMTDEFDQNFEREAFFSQAWERRKGPINSDYKLLAGKKERLRKSIMSRTTENSITFYTTEPDAQYHNDGCEIVVTKRMKRFFWWKYHKAIEAFDRKEDGTVRRNKANTMLAGHSEFWKFMALKKAGTTIKIPRRRFLGTSPEVEKAVREIIERNITEYINLEFEIKEK